MQLADCWRAAGRFDRAADCEERAARMQALCDAEHRKRAEFRDRLYSRHAMDRFVIAAIRAKHQRVYMANARIWDAWYMTHDCATCQGTGHNADVTAPCPDCKYGRTTPEPVFDPNLD